jgi:hypothetical protein
MINIETCLLYTKQEYNDWFKLELRNWLKANLVFIKITFPLGNIFWAKIDAILSNFFNKVYKKCFQ